jgi:general secretion pathway protein I
LVDRPSSDSGFTLLEVLVALTLLAMSMAVLLAVFSEGLDRAHANELRIAARNLAQTVLARAETAPPAALADGGGQSGAMSWAVRITPYGSAEDREAWQFSPVTLTATVKWQDHGRVQSVSISTLRLLQKADNS